MIVLRLDRTELRVVASVPAAPWCLLANLLALDAPQARAFVAAMGDAGRRYRLLRLPSLSRVALRLADAAALRAEEGMDVPACTDSVRDTAGRA